MGRSIAAVDASCLALAMNLVLNLLTGVLRLAQTIFGVLPRRFPTPAPPQHQRKDFSIEVVRPDDLLVLTLNLFNVQIDAPTSGNLAQVTRRASGNVFIIANFPPQSFGELAFFENGTSEPLLPPPVSARIAGASQLVFRIEDTLLPLDFTLDAILAALAQSEQLTQAAIRQPSTPGAVGTLADFGGPRGQFSAVEAPYRLVLSPNSESRWEHATGLVKNAGGDRTELWHTRLSADATAAAVWSPDFLGKNVPLPPPDDAPFRMSLQRLDRHEIVRSTADPTLPGGHAATVDRMMLSSQGAWLNVHGEWATALDLVEWRHTLTGGRDQFTRVVHEGRLFFFGHNAVTVEITERKIGMVKAGLLEGKPAAYLRKRLFVIAREPTKTFTHRHVPFRTVTIKSLVTPNLDDPKASELLPGQGKDAFWPRVSANGVSQDFLWHIAATDWEGRTVEFQTPLAFVAKSIADGNAALVQTIVDQFNARVETDERRHRDLGGQKVAFAPPKESGDTTLETGAMVFGAMAAPGNSPLFRPTMAKATVDVPAVRHLTGSSALSTIEFDPQYVAFSGAIGNMGEVFARLAGGNTPVNLPPDKTGGLVAPNFDITGISRAFGPVGGDIAQFAAGAFHPPDIFKGIKLLGGIDLGSIIRDLTNFTPEVANGKIPQLNSVRVTVPIDGTPTDVIETRYRWNVDAGGLIDTGLFTPEAGGEFYIETTVDTPLNGAAPVFSIKGGLKNFSVNLLPKPQEAQLIKLHFKSVTFTAKKDAKVDFAIVFGSFEFVGALSFVNDLQKVIPLDAFDDPPFLDVILPPDPSPGVNVGFTLGIPTVGVGIFSLAHISFSAGFFLPLIDKPANLRLAFCERHQPFTLTVSLFGGGGFFAMDIGFLGVTQIEAALEFGASIALNLGVASGEATVMAGVYYQKSGAGFEISAYFRAAGSLSVLGIITVSVELYVALSLESDKAKEHGGKLWGQASLTVKVKIAFFSKSVSISIEREFAGSDPTFAQMLAPSDWAEYCGAFADYPI